MHHAPTGHVYFKYYLVYHSNVTFNIWFSKYSVCMLVIGAGDIVYVQIMLTTKGTQSNQYEYQSNDYSKFKKRKLVSIYQLRIDIIPLLH